MAQHLDKYTWVRGDLVSHETPRVVHEDDDDMTSYERELGTLTAKFESLEREFSGMRDDVREVRDFMRDARSGWKVLTVAGGIGGAIAAGAIKFLPFLVALPK